MFGKKIKTAEDPAILYQRNAGEKIVFGIVFGLLGLYCLSLLLAFAWLILFSLEDSVTYAYNALNRVVFAFPKTLKFGNYVEAFEKFDVYGTNFYGMFWNSLWLTLSISVLTVFMHSVTGYVFSKYKFKLKPLIYFLAIFSMTVPIVGNTAASMKLNIALGLYDNPIGRIVGGLGGFGANFLIMLAIFDSVPWSYAEAVFIDGGNDFTVFFKIMLPQVVPAMTTLFVSAIISHWKEYESMLLYFPSYPTLNTGLYIIKSDVARYGAPVYYAGLVVSTIPVVLLYAFSSEAMMKNLSVGGLKG